MTKRRSTRRDFLKTSASLAALASIVPGCGLLQRWGGINVGSIGVGGRGSGIGLHAAQVGGRVLVCADADAQRAANFTKNLAEKNLGNECVVHDHYRRIIDRKDIDAVTIGTPDHWHAKIAIEAMQSGKDVYCEKPLSLTIREGQQVCQAVKETGQVFQVGTQQRSEYDNRFLKAVALVRSGRLGTNLKATASVGKAAPGGPFQETKPPPHLNWDLWLGQAPITGYIDKRTHYQFRWWFEYSGGQVTDWGVHHVDIAMWALGKEHTGPLSIEGEGVFDNRPNCYNVAQTYNCLATFHDGTQLTLNSERNDEEYPAPELKFEGSKGTIQVSRSRLIGKPIEEVEASAKERDWLNGEIRKLYRGMRMGVRRQHMQNFFDCIASRELPISDAFTHHRSVSICQLANIAMLTGKKLGWNPQTESFTRGGAEATAMLQREQRKGYKVIV